MRLPCVLVMVCLAGAARAQERLSGSWQGYWTRAGDTMPVSMRIEHDSSTGHYAATFAADRLRVSGIPFNEVRLEGCCEVRLLLRGDRTTIEFTGRLHGDSFSGVLTDSDGDGRFAYARVPAVTPLFDERDITFSSGAVTLSGTLLLPFTGDSLPAVVFLHGSGAEGRWASRFLAAKLASRGIATLIFDKRGVGGSTGDWRHATPDDLAADGAAAVARLRQEPRIDPRRIGIHGHSQGGTLAPLVVARATRVAFVIGSAASGLPTDSTERYSILNFVYPAATSAADSASASAYTNEVIAVAYHGRPRARMDSLATALRDRPWFFAPPPAGDAYWSFSPVFAKYHALEWWARVRVPVLLIYGAEDQRVAAAESAARIAAALRDAGNADVTVRILPRADHTFRLPPGPGGWPVTAPDYLASLFDWLKGR
jgi:dipeptidyl aminopeptidase/acylaminoacyl peptidase